MAGPLPVDAVGGLRAARGSAATRWRPRAFSWASAAATVASAAARTAGDGSEGRAAREGRLQSGGACFIGAVGVAAVQHAPPAKGRRRCRRRRGRRREPALHLHLGRGVRARLGLHFGLGQALPDAAVGRRLATPVGPVRVGAALGRGRSPSPGAPCVSTALRKLCGAPASVAQVTSRPSLSRRSISRSSRLIQLSLLSPSLSPSSSEGSRKRAYSPSR